MYVNIYHNTQSDTPHVIFSNEIQDHRVHSPFVHCLMKSMAQRLVLLHLAGINTEAASETMSIKNKKSNS
jgi:hypothetical protein